MIDLLPFGRLKLVASALVTTIIVSFVFLILGLPATDPASPVDYANFLVYFGTATTVWDYMEVPFFWNIFAMGMLWAMWVYAVLWSLAGITVGTTRRMLLLIPLLSIVGVMPMMGVRRIPHASTAVLVTVISVIWFLFALCILMAPRLRRIAAGPLFTALRKVVYIKARYTAGSEMRLLLGLGTRWLHCLSIGVCVVWSWSVISGRGTWYFWLTILALVAGGMPAYAAAKGRALWLLQPWSRAEFFAQVESFYWRHAGPSIALLLTSFVAIGANVGLSWQVIAMGIVHGAVTAVASIYLGLRQTDSNRRFSDAALAVCILLLGILPGGGSDPIGVVAMTVLLALMTLRFRFTAKRRWTYLDWSVCRPMRVA